MEVTCELERSLLPRKGGNVVLAVQCKDGKGTADTKRPNVSIAAALDRSASMKGTRIEDLKAATRALVERLGPDDRLVLIAFDETVEVLAAGPVVDKADFVAEIDRIECRSGTNISLALETCGSFLESDASEGNRVKRILLLTDGEASKGDTTAAGLARRAEKLTRSEISTTCLGFGLTYDEDTLALLAGAGAGRLHHVNDRTKLEAIYAGELDRMRALVAPWIGVTVTPAQGARVLGSRNAYPMKRTGDGLELELSDLRSEEARWVLFDVQAPSAGPKEDEAPLADVEVAWRDPSGGTHEVSHHLTMKYAHDAAAEDAEANGDVLLQMALLDVAAAKERALRDADDGQIAEGTIRLQNSLARIAGTTARRDFGLARELRRLDEIARRLGQLDPEKRKEIRVEIQDGRTPTFRIDLGDAPPL